MELFLTNGFVVTKPLASFVTKHEENGTDYLVVFTDGANLLFTEGFRIQSLAGTVGYKVVNTDMMDHNESDENFASAVNELYGKLSKDEKITKVYFESFNDKKDVDNIVKELDFDVVTYNECRGHLLKDREVYLKHAHPKWVKRFGNAQLDILTSSIQVKHDDAIRFVMLSEDKGELLATMGYDYDWNKYFFPDSFAKDITEVEVFVSVVSETMGLDVKDYMFRTYVNDGFSTTVVFLLVEDVEGIFHKNRNIEVDDYSDFITLPVRDLGQYGGKGAWVNFITTADEMAVELINETLKKE